MKIFICQGKGKKHRYTLLLKANLQILREYWKKYQSKEFLFSGRYCTDAITSCRTSELGGHVEECDECGHVRISYNSCRDRHCPKCQTLA